MRVAAAQAAAARAVALRGVEAVVAGLQGVAAGVAEDSANRKVMMQLYATLREKAEAAEAEAKTQAATAEVAAKVAMAAPRAKTKEYEDAARVAALQWCDERGSSPDLLVTRSGRVGAGSARRRHRRRETRKGKSLRRR